MFLMKNAYFSDEDLTVLQSYSQIKLVTSDFSDISSVVPDNKYLKWVNKNSDSHNHIEILIVLKGNTYFTLNGITYPCIPGTVFLVASNESHDNYYPPFFDNFKHLWCTSINSVIYAGGLYTMENGCQIKTVQFNRIIDESSCGFSFTRIWEELSQNQYLDENFKHLYIKNALFVFLLELCKIGYAKTANAGERETEEHYCSIINPILEHIKETGGKGLDIARLAYIAGYSKFHFARIFRKVTGFSVLTFINSARIEKYKELHKAGCSKKQISDKLGFSCPAAFSRWEKDNLRL